MKRRSLPEPPPALESARFLSAPGAQLPVEIGEAILHRAFAQEEGAGDLGVAEPQGNRAAALQFSRFEPRDGFFARDDVQRRVDVRGQPLRRPGRPPFDQRAEFGRELFGGRERAGEAAQGQLLQKGQEHSRSTQPRPHEPSAGDETRPQLGQPATHLLPGLWREDQYVRHAADGAGPSGAGGDPAARRLRLPGQQLLHGPGHHRIRADDEYFVLVHDEVMR